MKKTNRRDFLKGAAAIGAVGVGLSATAKASSSNVLSEDRMGVLVDTTACIGCRHCEWACRSSHGLPAGELNDYQNREVFKELRRPDETALTVVNEFKNENDPYAPIAVKVQCMHCDHPACASACIVGAFTKNENGAVTWDTGKCIGCRYCMVACPFQVPAFEYEKAMGSDILKCDFCFERTKEGQLPACVEICPMEALIYGTRSEVIKTAREKIALYPERYKNHILGEKEVGGTSWVYIGSKDMTKLGFPKLKHATAPGVSESIQHGLFSYFVPPIALYSLLGGIMWLTKKRQDLD